MCSSPKMLRSGCLYSGWSGIAGPRASGRRCAAGMRGELDVELVEAPEDPRRLVREPARARRSVVLLRQPDVAHPVEDALEADAGLRARQRTAGARVHAAPERDVLLHVRAVEAELGRALEAARVAVGGAVEQ